MCYSNKTTDIIKLSVIAGLRKVIYDHKSNVSTNYYPKEEEIIAYRAVITYCMNIYSGTKICPKNKPRSMRQKVYDALSVIDQYIEMSRNAIRYNKELRSLRTAYDATRLQYIVGRIYTSLIMNGDVLDTSESKVHSIITDYMHTFYTNYMNSKLSHELWRGDNVLHEYRAAKSQFRNKIDAVVNKISARGYHNLAHKLSNASVHLDDLGIAMATIIDEEDGLQSYGIIRLQRVVSKIKFDMTSTQMLVTNLSLRNGDPNNIISDYTYSIKPESIKPMKLLRIMLGDTYFDDNIACNSSLSEQLNHFMNLNYDNTTNVITHSFEHDDLILAYDSSKYAVTDRESSLHESCMKDDFEMIEFYNRAKLAGVVIARDPLGDVVGRAILWDSVTIFSEADKVVYIGKFMDRVYSIDEEVRSQIYSYCEKNNWARKLKPNRYPDNPALLPDGSTVSSPTIVSNNLVPRSFMPVVNRDQDCEEQFPYIDTMAYIHRATRLISNKTLFKGRYFELQNTDGSYSIHSVSEPYYCRDKESSLYKFMQKLDTNNKYINA